MKRLLFVVLMLTATCASAGNLEDGNAAIEKKDYVTALIKFKLSAAQGNAPAQYNLGLMYANGYGVTQDYVEAVRWFKLSAAQGDAYAQYNLGVMYDDMRRNGECQEATEIELSKVKRERDALYEIIDKLVHEGQKGKKKVQLARMASESKSAIARRKRSKLDVLF